MNEPKLLRTRQIRIFEPDVIPFSAILSRIGQRLFMEAFNFRAIELNEASEVLLSNGVLVIKENEVSIRSLTIGDRKVAIEVDGPTSAAELAIGALGQLLATTFKCPNLDSISPILKTDETDCVVQLDLDWSRLFDPRLQGFFDEFGRTFGASSSAAGAHPSAFRVACAYRFQPRSDLEGTGASLADKWLVIEPRANTPLSERRFWISSPLDSERHLQMVNQLEQRLIDSDAVSRKK